MDLDTSVKEFKYSSLKKLICILLSFVTFLSAGWLAVFSIASLAYFKGAEADGGFTATSNFSHYLQWDLNCLAGDVYYAKVNDDLRAELYAVSDDIINKAYEQYTELNKIAIAQDFYDEYYDEYSEYTTRSYFSDDADISVRVKTDNVDKMFSFRYYSIDSTDIVGQIEEEYNSFVEECMSYNFDVYTLNERKCVRYYAKYADREQTNFNQYNLSTSDVANANMYISFVNGRVESKGIDKKAIDYLKERVFGNPDFQEVELYVIFDMPESTLSLLGTIENYDIYVALRDFYYTASRYIARFDRNIAFAGILLIASFICAFLYFTVAGKRSYDEKARLAYIDYLPVELHIGAVGGLCALLFVLGMFMCQELEFSLYAIYALIPLVACAWWLIFKLCASLSRSIMSERKFYKFLLGYWILFAFYKLTRLYFKGNAKLFRAIRRSAARTRGRINNLFSYKTGIIKRRAIVLSALYFVCNLIFSFILVLSFYEEMAVIYVPLLLIMLVGNIFVIVRVIDYLINLDKIIAASSEHREPDVDVDRLPMSLKALVEGMRYTNAELNSAVAKAVKDERLRSELITNVSHDLKTPLTSIINYVDLLSRCDIDDERAREYISVLDEKGARLKRLIDDLIEASKVTSGNVTVNLTTINLAELCLQSTVDAQADFEKAGLDLIVKDCDKAPVVMADGTKTFRVIENLLSNARKYSAKASRVYVDVYSENGFGVFEIKNISAQALDISPDELTERFVRGDKSRNQDGNGLGLSIAKELCSLQNGTLELVIDGDLFKARVKLPLNK